MKKGALKGRTGPFLSVFWILLLTGLYSHSQNAITGVVKDKMEKPLSGVSIHVNGKPAGMTNADGTFAITATPTSTLLFTHTGYQSTTHKLNGTTPLIITLAESVDNLDNVVVIGYGTSR